MSPFYKKTHCVIKSIVIIHPKKFLISKPRKKMNKKQKKVLFISLVVIMLSAAVWLYYGGEIFTKTEVLVEKQDELFGTTYRVWEDKFIWGLDLSLVISGVTAVVCGILFIVFKKKNKA